ncbi:MAG: hypothetical protein ACRCU5_09960, partial [Rhizobiaceae bacterium]
MSNFAPLHLLRISDRGNPQAVDVVNDLKSLTAFETACNRQRASREIGNRIVWSLMLAGRAMNELLSSYLPIIIFMGVAMVIGIALMAAP